MSLALNRENFFWHKLHSLAGIIPVGFYVLQHLTLNSFSIAGESYFDGVINFFGSIPLHVLLAAEIVLIWVPILFHGIYGLFITNRAQINVGSYKFSQNWMYTIQRYTGIYLFLFLILHVSMTTGNKYLHGNDSLIKYAAMHQMLSQWGYLMLVIYILGVATASWHLSIGIWNFCIRWGITISEESQARVQRFSMALFVVVTLLGWAALIGFFIHPIASVV
ncbi:MAG TPA: hypothetical protein VMI31_12235 [Fimbriimonadaceae bacterium]|nr:hypothetical protein [Fimbriimonadaceae bacterium]